ncbi:MAG: FtsQ-type POTRA domain-containing protein [Hyphomicrobiaceae bacterium]|nr:FtsQ-type POTRA domain-containing protein [Hyphomicrobiaceae bacterium]
MQPLKAQSRAIAIAKHPLALMPQQTRMPVRAAGAGPLVRAHRSVNRAWVLHRRWFIYAFAGIAIALLAAGLFQARGGIAQAGTTLGHLLSGRFAAAGVGISEITITGQALTQEKQIAEALEIAPNDTIFQYDADAARQRLLELPAVTDATIRKVYPSQLVITIEEAAPIARWRVDGVTFLIDAKGRQLAVADPADETLPLVIGDGAEDDAAMIISVLSRHPVLESGLAAISRIADRRWDFIYSTGLRVQMPERGFAQALNLLEAQQASAQILDRDIDVIDLRVPGLIAITPTKREDD